MANLLIMLQCAINQYSDILPQCDIQTLSSLITVKIYFSNFKIFASHLDARSSLVHHSSRKSSAITREAENITIFSIYYKNIPPRSPPPIF